MPACLPGDEASEKGRAISEALSAAVPEGYLGLSRSVLRPVCMLNRRLSLYWKWLHWQFLQMPKWSGQLEPFLQDLEGSSGHRERAGQMVRICGAVREAVHAEGLLPDARPRHAMGALELLRSIGSEEVKDLVRELDPNLGRGLAE